MQSFFNSNSFLSLFLLPLAPLCRNLKFALSFRLMFYEVSTTFLKSLIYTLSRTSNIAGMLFWQLRSVYFLTINFNFFLKIPWNLVSLAVPEMLQVHPFDNLDAQRVFCLTSKFTGSFKLMLLFYRDILQVCPFDHLDTYNFFWFSSTLPRPSIP